MKNAVKSVEKTPIVPILIGKSKLARHLRHYFRLLESKETGFKHKHFDDARDLTNPDLYRKIKGVNTLWILTNDQSIESVFTKIKKEMVRYDLNPDHYTFIHSSAASTIKGMQTIHPLMTFGENFYSFEQYQNIPFAVISEEAETLSNRLPFSNPHFVVSPKNQALYHAYAVLISNIPILLWSLTANEAKENLFLDPHVFDPILKQTVENFIQDRGDALTGPIARKDHATIEKNLTALGNTPLSGIYKTFLSAISKEITDDNRS